MCGFDFHSVDDNLFEMFAVLKIPQYKDYHDYIIETVKWFLKWRIERAEQDGFHLFIHFFYSTLTSKIVSCPSLAILKIILKFQHTRENNT